MLGRQVCASCHQRFRRNPAHCPGCGQLRVLAFLDPDGHPACATCTGHDPVYACPQCGSEEHPYGTRCCRCVLAERVHALLADPTGTTHPQLVPVRDALLGARRPRSVLNWLRRSTGPALLARMAQGHVPIDHTTFQGLPANKTNNYLRDLLVALQVLPGYHAELERVTPWLRDLLATQPTGDADIVARYARWHVLRRLHIHRDNGTLTHGAIQGARGAISSAVRYLDWLQQRGTPLARATQDDLERYLSAHPGRDIALTQFLAWANDHHLAAGARPPTRHPAPPQVTLSDEQRWAHVHTLLHDDTIRLYTRLAGLFMLLFAQPVARIVRMRATQVTISTSTVHVTFDRVPVEMPAPLDDLLRRHLDRPGQAGYVSHPDRWLFPGGIPGNHLVTENIRSQLVENAIQPSDARKAALYQLAGSMPAPVLADLLGLTDKTATRWATLAARDWSNYVAQRHAPQ